ncbi:kinase-like domain-containing protein [Melanogaster broomeanus]|nr:kinase-like domain-containing protein [Melanogaster broomeanus]
MANVRDVVSPKWRSELPPAPNVVIYDLSECSQTQIGSSEDKSPSPRTLKEVGLTLDSAQRPSHTISQELCLRERSSDDKLPDRVEAGVPILHHPSHVPEPLPREPLVLSTSSPESPAYQLPEPPDAMLLQSLRTSLVKRAWMLRHAMAHYLLCPILQIGLLSGPWHQLPVVASAISGNVNSKVSIRSKMEPSSVCGYIECGGSEVERRNKRLRRELKVWEQLDHENILPLWGVVSGFGPMLAMVSPWAENGTLTSYLHRHQRLPTRKSIQFVMQHSGWVALSAYYPWRHYWTDGKACVADFGLSIILEFTGTSYMTLTSAQSDIYSFGCIMYQVLSGNIPYHYLSRPEQVLWYLMRRETPKRPKAPQLEIADEHWAFIQRCWTHHDAPRPSEDEIVDFVTSEYRRLMRP